MIITRGLGGLLVTQGYGGARIALVYPYCPSPEVYHSNNLYIVDELIPYSIESNYALPESLYDTDLVPLYSPIVDQYTQSSSVDYNFMNGDSFSFMDGENFDFGGYDDAYSEIESPYAKSESYTNIVSPYTTEAYPCDPVEVPVEEFNYEFMDGTNFEFMDGTNFEFSGGEDSNTFDFMDGTEYTFMDGTAYDFK